MQNECSIVSLTHIVKWSCTLVTATYSTQINMQMKWELESTENGKRETPYSI